jgi:hypothetical protein
MRLKPIARTAVDILAIDVIDPWLRKKQRKGRDNANAPAL